MNRNDNPSQQAPYYQGQQPRQQAQRQGREKINEATVVGIVRPRKKDPTAPIDFHGFPDGGGVINFNLQVSEPMYSFDEYGNPRERVTYVPVAVKTNQKITVQQLRSIMPGMKVRVNGHLRIESYTNRQGQERKDLIVEGYVLEVLEMPMQQYAPQGMQQPYYGAPAPMQAPQYQQGQPMPPQYPQQGAYQGQQPFYGAPSPMQAPGYAPNPAPSPFHSQQGPAPAPGYAPQQGQKAQPQAGRKSTLPKYGQGLDPSLPENQNPPQGPTPYGQQPIPAPQPQTAPIVDLDSDDLP